ncbi:hypothetical protein HPB47_007922 [Ixodes persulcatus]|uniref:Uncharacterized protein n=1 Tax=Ixodes persulcatus TaxID=34615 RepID=A0AC60P649_IXOPE|nr:hypothetical protein HPB47_007922 [Ixodes persulcatus]
MEQVSSANPSLPERSSEKPGLAAIKSSKQKMKTTDTETAIARYLAGAGRREGGCEARSAKKGAEAPDESTTSVE